MKQLRNGISQYIIKKWQGSDGYFHRYAIQKSFEEYVGF